jgi:hypothetical protein
VPAALSAFEVKIVWQGNSEMTFLCLANSNSQWRLGLL